METKIKPIPAREMHKIVWVSVGVLTLFFMTFPIAMWRISKKKVSRFSRQVFHNRGAKSR